MKRAVWVTAGLLGLSLLAADLKEKTDPESGEAVSLRVVRIGDMAVDRAAHQATRLGNGQVLITGGCAGRGCERILDSVELFDPGTRSFRAVAPMTVPRASHAAVALPDGRVLVSGGWTDQGAAAGAEIYDPGATRWTISGNMTVARVSHIAVPLDSGRVLMVGGGGGRLGDLTSAEVFDPSTSTFSAVGRMRTNHYLATRLADGRVLVTGGQDARGEILASAEIFDPATGAFKRTGRMTVARVKHAAALLPDGRILIIGGSDRRGYAARFASTEIYDPESGEFSPGPTMKWARHKIRDAVVPVSGGILVAGGALRLELFVPADNGFVPIEGELSGPQMFATATALESGEVLILGGYDDRTRPSAGAWLVSSAR